MVKVNIRDSNFGGEPSSCHKGTNKFVKWEFGNERVSDTCFITDLHLQDVLKASGVKRKVAWILEPKAIHPDAYNWISENNRLFDFVLTFDKDLLSRGENFLYYPHGRCWINNYEHDKKTKLISTFASPKKFTEGHKLRFDVANKFSEDIDAFGKGLGRPVETKEEGLSPYYYSITIENSRQPGYWTEKIVDCFATKTIPIFWGDSDINNYFDKDGIIYFNDINELSKIINDLKVNGHKIYEDKKHAIEKNFELVEKYRIPEDWMYNNYRFLFK